MRTNHPGGRHASAGLLALLVLALGAGCADQQPTAVPRPSASAPRFTVDPGAGVFAYVVNEGGNTVSVIRTSDNTVVATVNVGHGPEAIAITPDGTMAYVTNNRDNSVSVIQTSDNTVVKIVPVGVAPLGIAMSPDGKMVYVTNLGNLTDPGTVSVIQTSDNTVVATVNVGISPTGIAITPDGTKAYVANLGNGTAGTVSVIDTQTSTVTTLNVGGAPFEVAISPNGSTAYVTNDVDAGTVLVINTSTNTFTTLSVGRHPVGIAITPDGSRAYVANTFAGTVSVIDTQTSAVTTLNVGGFPLGVAITPDGSTAYVTSYFGASVSVIQTSDNTLLSPVTVGSDPRAIAIAKITASPTEQILSLQSTVSSLPNLGPGDFSASLEAKLNDALTALDAGDIPTACTALQDFINEVAAQSGKKISAADATTLIHQATAIRTQIGC